MKQWIRGGVLIVMTAAAPAATSSSQAPLPGCHRVNQALLISAQEQAKADFWFSVAEALGDPQGNVFPGIKAAYVDMSNAKALALQIFQARETLCADFGHLPYSPAVIAAEFSATITNPYAPVRPGRTLVREKLTPEGLERIETSMGNDVHMVNGIACRTVREYETLDGVLVEDSRNWIAQHQNGAVWYFGELVMSYQDSVLENLDGSWRYGREGALPGILALGLATPGDRYRQEYLLGRAEDVARVVRTGETVVVPAGVFHNCLVIEEWDPLEPFEFLLSFIAPHVGLVLEVDLNSGERSELVAILN